MLKSSFAAILLASAMAAASDIQSVGVGAPAFAPTDTLATSPEPSPESAAVLPPDDPLDRLTQAVYIHPLYLQATLGSDSVPLFVPLTYERELGRGKSFTVQPTFIAGKVATDVVGEPRISVVGVQASFAYHMFFNGRRAKGFYAGPAIRALYLHASQPAYEDRYGDRYDRATADEVGAGLLGFVGFRGKWRPWTLYVDLGLGAQLVRVSGNTGYSVSDRGLAVDANLGFGIPF